MHRRARHVPGLHHAAQLVRRRTLNGTNAPTLSAHMRTALLPPSLLVLRRLTVTPPRRATPRRATAHTRARLSTCACTRLRTQVIFCHSTHTRMHACTHARTHARTCMYRRFSGTLPRAQRTMPLSSTGFVFSLFDTLEPSSFNRPKKRCSMRAPVVVEQSLKSARPHLIPPIFCVQGKPFSRRLLFFVCVVSAVMCDSANSVTGLGEGPC